MDIAGAKALKERLGHKGNAPRTAAPADVSEDAPPVYHYLGVSDAQPQADAPAGESHGRPRSLLRRLGLTFR
jgi:hypothetical protein